MTPAASSPAEATPARPSLAAADDAASVFASSRPEPPGDRMHSLRKFHAIATSGLISSRRPATAMLSAVCTRSLRRLTTSAWSARRALTRGKEASRLAAASSGVCLLLPCMFSPRPEV